MKPKITKRSDGRYMRKMPDENGKYKYFYGDSEEEVYAKIKEFELKQKIKDELYSNIETVSDYIDYWLKNFYYTTVGDTTYDRQESVFISQIKSNKIGNMKLYLVTADDLQKFINEKIAAGYSTSELDKIMQILRGAFEQATTSNYIVKNPMLGVKYSKRKINREKERAELEKENLLEFDPGAYSNDEIELIKKTINESWNDKKYYLNAPAIILQLKTIIRIGELLGLLWTDIDFDKKTMEIKKGVVSVKKRDENLNYIGKKEVKINPPKTKAGKRTIDLCPDAIDALIELKKRYELLGINSKFVVCTLASTRESVRNFNRTIERVCSRASITYKSSHKLRATGITALVNNRDVNITDVQQVAGQTKASTTMGYVKKFQIVMLKIDEMLCKKFDNS